MSTHNGDVLLDTADDLIGDSDTVHPEYLRALVDLLATVGARRDGTPPPADADATRAQVTTELDLPQPGRLPEVFLAHDPDPDVDRWNVFCSGCPGPDGLPGIAATDSASAAAPVADRHLAHHRLAAHWLPGASAELEQKSRSSASADRSSQYRQGLVDGALAATGLPRTGKLADAVRVLVYRP